MKKDYGKSPYWVLTIAIFLVIAFAYISFQLSGKVRNVERRVAKNQEIILQLENIQHVLLYNESNAKSYIITPTPQLEDLLKQVPALLRQEIRRLDSLIADEPADQQGIDSLLYYAERRIDFSMGILKIRKETGFAASVAAINSPAENHYISKTRSLINRWRDVEMKEQQHDLNSKKNILNNFNQLLFFIFFFMIVLGVVYVLQLLNNIKQRNIEIERGKYFQAIMDNISEPVITTDANFKIRTWNKAAEKIYGLDSDLSKETDIAVAVHSQISYEEMQLIRSEMRKNGFWKGELRHLNAEGHEIFVQVLISALVDKNGKITGFVSANRDVTDERLAQSMIRKFNQVLAEQVKEKTAELTNVFERVSDAFVALDANWNYTYINKKAEQFFNKPVEYLIGKHIRTEFPEEMGQLFHLAYEKAFNEQQYIYLEEYYPRYDRWFENHIYPSPTGLSIYFRDITEKKKAEIALKESEVKYRTLIEQASDAIYIADENGRYIDVNTSCCKLAGYTTEELLTLSIKDIVVIDEDFIPFRLEELKAGKTVIQQRKMRNKNGTVVVVEVCSTLLADGKMLGIARDLTERIEIEKKLQKEKELSDKIINSLPGIFYLSDPSPRMIRWNKDFEIVSGYSAEELSQIEPITLFLTEDRYKVRQSLEKTYKEGQATIEARLLTKSGTIIPYYFTGVRIEYEGRMAMLGTGIDISEQKKAEEELRETARFLKETQSIAKLGTYVLDIKTGNWTGSELLYQILGIDDDFDKTFEGGQAVIHPEWRKMMTDYFAEEVIGKKNRFNIEYKIIRPNDNEERWIHGIGDLKFNDKNEPVSLLATIQDITERKKIAEALAESENRLRIVYNTEPVCIKILNSKGELLEMNPAGLAMIEADNLEEVKGQSVLNIIDKEFRKDFDRLIKNVISNKPDNLKFSITGIKGTKRWMETHAVPMKNPGGEIIALLGVTMDVTEKRKAELELKENEEKYRTLVEQAVDAIALFNTSGKILDVNTGAVDLLGYSKKELIEMYLPDILTEKEIKKKPVRYDILQKGDSTIRRRIMRKKDGTLVQTEIRSQQLPDGRFLSVIRDLTERIQAEKDLEDSYQAIRKLTSHIQNVREEERTSIAREIHDELGQQLTVMKMDVSWLKKEVGVKNESINIRLKELIGMLDETVKSVRRISAQLRPSLLDDLGLAAAMEWQLQEFEKRSGISTRFITSKAEIKLPVDINTALYRIFQESLTNVARHSKAQNVTVNLMEKNDQLILSIADDGKGFDKQEIANKKTLGILGMKERTAMIDGIYTIESIPDKGTLTTVSISLAKINIEQLTKINVEQ